MANILKRSLKLRVFVLFLAVSIVAVSILGSIAYLAGRNALEKAITDGYTNITSVTEASIADFLAASHVEFSLLDGDRFMAETTERLMGKDPNSERLLKDLIEYLKELKSGNPDSVEYFIMDMHGKIIVSTDEKHIGVDRSNDEFFTRAQKEVHLKDVYKSDLTGQIGFVVSGPLYAVSKELLGVFGIRFDMSEINAITSDYKGMGKTGETYIVNKDGYMITESRFQKDSLLRQKVDSEPVKVWQAREKETAGVYADYRGSSVLGVSMGEELLKRHPELDWVVISEIDEDEALAPVARLGKIMLVLGVVISMAVALLAYWIAQGIAKPIGLISLAAQKIGEGDLTVDVAETKAEDEIGVLSKSFGRTIMNLRAIVAQVLQTAERVSSSSQQLSSTAQQMNATTEEVSSTVQQIAKGSVTQAQRVEETRRAMEQMASAVEQVSKSAQGVAAQAEEAAKTARAGGEAAQSAQQGMVRVADVVGNSAQVMRRLGERSEQIGEIVKVITNIADQTNLLALNAAIEAARAGEYGRGFAVVAEEVRKLAEASSRSSDEIGKIIRDVQKETSLAVSSVENADKEVASVKEIARRLQEGLEKIVRNGETLASMAAQVSAASQQQASATGQVSKSVSEIASVAEETASGSEEASASAEEMTASMEEMAASAQELADMGIAMRDLVAKFEIGRQEEAPAVQAGRSRKSAGVPGSAGMKVHKSKG